MPTKKEISKAAEEEAAAAKAAEEEAAAAKAAEEEAAAAKAAEEEAAAAKAAEEEAKPVTYVVAKGKQFGCRLGQVKAGVAVPKGAIDDKAAYKSLIERRVLVTPSEYDESIAKKEDK